MTVGLPFGFGNLDFSDWVRGLVAAAVSGGSSAVISGFVVASNDPNHYGIGSPMFYQLVWRVFAGAATLGFFGYLAQKPVPELKQVTTTVKTTEQEDKPPVVVKTVQEVHTEPLEPKQGG